MSSSVFFSYGLATKLDAMRGIDHSITEEAWLLSEESLKQKILKPKFRDDALHIAMASLANVDVLVSWNFRILVIMTRFVCLMTLT